LRKLNILPENPEKEEESGRQRGRFPSWLHRKLPKGSELFQTGTLLEKYRLNTVCEECKCPNRLECYGRKIATFLALGKACTRSCGFCEIDFTKQPKAPEEDEPMRIALATRDLGLKHAVITMVARDDLPDGGASHMAAITRTIREVNPGVTIELLTSDFAGNLEALDQLLEARPEIFNHNIETVRALTPRVRHRATYDRTLAILSHAKQSQKTEFIKSGIMVGLGETEEEVKQTILDLKMAGCDIITIGQYLQPSQYKLGVKAFVPPERFKAYEEYGLSIGVTQVYSGPFVRSSYNAAEKYTNLI
jgi:lipoic acid synthetase